MISKEWWAENKVFVKNVCELQIASLCVALFGFLDAKYFLMVLFPTAFLGCAFIIFWLLLIAARIYDRLGKTWNKIWDKFEELFVD